MLTWFASPLISWWAVWTQPADERAGWRRSLLWLAVLDTLVCACSVLLVARGGLDKPPTSARVGVQLVSPERAPNVIVAGVAAGSPAERAELRAGDRIVQVDLVPIVSSEQLTREIGATPEGTSRGVLYERDGVERFVVVTPSRRANPTQRALFEPSSRAPSSKLTWQATLPALSMLMVVGGLVLAARRRGQSPRPGLLTGAAVVAWMATTLLADRILQATLGASIGSALLTLIAASFVLGAVGFVSLRFVPPAERVVDPLPARQVFARGLFYCVAFAVRVAIVASALAPLLHLPNQSAAEAFGISRSWGASTVALFLLAGVVVAPAAEELVFRGLLVPWLRRWMGDNQVMVWSSLAFAVGHLYYGASVIITLVYGVVLAWARLRTGSVRVGIALHMALNAIATFGALTASGS